ncbi:AF4/FMR2 family member lilliputian isoform X2 [Haematobia irritans]|uniref:AF4/FMR2 family member lilliputian isoform X2 n=1 Tax=Haematobia irritans TaxID=7368 RepID=UPI003F50ABB3
MDMKKLSKPRMDDYEYERKQRREREKSERQQVQTSSSSNREVALFPEPRRVNPSEDDDNIAAKLGDYSKVREYINLYTVGISNSGHRQMPANAVLPGIVPTSPASSASSSLISPLPSSSSSMRLLPPQSSSQSQQPPHHYQQHQQQLRQAPYVKQADNKPPYNGRGGYPGQPVNRSSSGMAPPKGPPSSSSSLMPPTTAHMPNGRQTSSSSANEKSYLGPPAPTMHNGRFSQPSIPKQRQKPAFPSEENDINDILNHVTSTFRPPTMLTAIDATPHNTLMENYNLSEPNKHKYSFDISAKVGAIEPLMDSPPRNEMPAPRFVPPLSAGAPSATQMPSTQSASSNSNSSLSASSSSMSSSTYIAPLPPANASVSANSNVISTSSSSGQSASLLPSSLNSAAYTASPTVPLSPLMGRPKDTGFLKPFKSEKPTPPPLERQNNPVALDLELSESDDDRVKQNRSALNTSDSSPSDSSESGSESSKSEPNQPTPATSHHHLQQQQQMSNALASKKKIGGPGSTAGSSSSSGLGSSAPPSGGSSSSSSNKTPSPSNTTKWQLSRYFNKAPMHQTPTQDVVSPSTTSVMNSVNSMNVANINMPITLRGGAQIIPEQLTNIKNESMLDDNEEDDGDDVVESVPSRRSRSKKDSGKNDTFPHSSLAAASAAFPTRKTPASLSVTPLSPMLTDIKKEASTPHPNLVLGPTQQHMADYLAMNSNQIKHETMVLGGGHTTVTPCDVEGFSNLSSNSNSSDEGTRERLPVCGPGGTLQIPGVPAAITALPRSPPIMQKAAVPNTVTMIPIGPLPSSPPSVAGSRALSATQPTPTRAKKPRKKLKQAQSAALAPDTSDEEQEEIGKQRLTSPAGAATKTITTPGGTKKGRGRPRKTPNQSGNLSSASSASASAKGPTLTAKKDISKKPSPASSTTPSSKESSATARRRMSRLSSTAQEPPVSVTAPVKPLPTTAATKPIPPPSHATPKSKETISNTSDDSSSSSDSSSYSNSKSSSSSSDSESEATKKIAPIGSCPTVSSSSDDDDDVMRQKSTAAALDNAKSNDGKTKATKRIVKKLNPPRKSSLEDLSTASSTKVHNICLSSASSSSSESSAEDFRHGASFVSQQTSTGAAAVASNNTGSGGGGSSSQRSVNQQSPFKVASALSNRNRKHTPCSSAFSSESSAEDNSDSDSGEPTKEKKLKRDKPKSDKNKISTLTRIFKSSNEGGAKKQGQVVIVDQSEEQQQQQQQQKHISPALRGSQENLSAAQNSLQNTPTAQSPRLTPGGQLRSPRSLPMQPLVTQVLTAGCMMATASHRTPDRAPFDRATTSAERKLQQRIKTPTRTPTRTPPTTRTPTPTPTPAAPASAIATTNPPSASPVASVAAPTSLPSRLPSSLICKIDLSRLLHIPAEWHANTYRLYGGQTLSGQNSTPASAGRTPIYDHETILNADLQSCNTQMRLKSSSGGGTGSGGGSGNVTPRSTGNRTPLQATSTISTASERELSHSRESLHEIVKDNGNTGRLSSRSTDGSIGGGGTTPKDLSAQLLPPGPPNGYSSVAAMARGYPSPSALIGGKLGLAGVKHEQMIKHEPDANEYGSCNETKFKPDATSTDPAHIKQELLILKQDYKPSDLLNITEKTAALCSPKDQMQLLDAKPRRKRSSSSSSSPYKEKKRKKEKERDKEKDKEKEKEKDREKDKDREKISLEKDNKERDSNGDSLKTNKTGSLDTDLISSNGQTQKEDVQILSQQFPPTNHERLLPEKSTQQEQNEKSKSNNNNNNDSNGNSNNLMSNVSSTASPAHLENCSTATTVTATTATAQPPQPPASIMPPPSNVGGLLPTMTTTTSSTPSSTSASTAALTPQTTMAMVPPITTISNSSKPTILPTSSSVSGNNNPTTMSKSVASSGNNVTAPVPQVIYRSYFERDDDAISDEFRFVAESLIEYSNSSTYSTNNNNTTNSSVTAKFQNLFQNKDKDNNKFLQEAVQRKHAADREQNTFNQVALYLEAVVYFLLTGAAMEQHSRSEDPAWTMYKDTLSLIKYISSKFRHLQVQSSNQHETHNKVAILSLRCQSLISLKLYKLKRGFCRQVNNLCTEFFKSGKGDIINGNTSSSISPSNSGSGSNTPPGKIVPQDIHSALHQQNQFFNYLASSHELWDQADRLVRQGNHTDFFIALDHENGPLTLHSNVYEVFRYVQAGLKKLKDEMLIQ